MPVDCNDRTSTKQIRLTSIGKFGLLRKARPGVPAHLHTGIDIQRPHDNYKNEPIFPISKGIVISKRDDGAFAQLIIEHSFNGKKFWTVYEHIAGIVPKLNDIVDPMTPIARFMTREELNSFGWQFDHVHFEILKVKPQKIKPSPKTPERIFNSYTLECHSTADVEKYFYEPLLFFETMK
jgi:murein DD-endopeptidase MepM/ murein hydrolase activator NlpD